MRVLIGPSSFGECGNEPVNLLLHNGYELVMNRFGRPLTADEVAQLGKDCVGIIAGVEPLTRDVIARLPELRCISRCGAGTENVDLRAAEARGIFVCNTPDAPTRAVAELTLGLALGLLRRFPLADRNMRKGIWRKEIGNLLADKTVGIIGLGRIGQAVAELFLSLGCNVCATDPLPDAAWLSRHSLTMLLLEELLTHSDIVCLHLSFQDGDKPIIGEAELRRMKKSTLLLNLSRGGAVEELALYRALKVGQITGAAIDVFSTEPYSGPLLELENVILTPHLGSYAAEAKLRMEVLSVRNLMVALGKSCNAEE